VDLDEIVYAGDGIEDDIDSILLNFVALSIKKLRTFKLLWWVQLLNCLVDLDEIYYARVGIEDDIYPKLLNSVASTIPKWRTFKLPGGVKILN
jgi:hypothetical protein